MYEFLPAFVIGNGTSRSDFELSKLNDNGIIYGCNALYRDFTPDYLVAIDDGIIEEITKSDFPEEQCLFPPMEERWEPAECNPGKPRSNAGINAVLEAIKKGHKSIYGLGFDFLVKGNQSISNMYDGTENYTPETRATVHDSNGRTRYLEYVADKYPDVKFTFVFPAGVFDFIYLKPKNIRGMFYSDFEEALSGSIE